MKEPNPNRRSRRRVIAIIALGAISLHLAGLIFFHSRPLDDPAPRPEVSGVTMAPPDAGEEGSQALREYAVLRDTTPLYLPTRWNAGYEMRIRGLERRPGDLFPPFSPELSLERIDIAAPWSFEPPPTPIETVLHFDTAPYHAFRGEPSPPAELPQRTARFQIVSTATGEEVFSADRHDPLPTEDQLWAPAIFGVQITRLGMAGPPILLESSGIEEIDTHLGAHVRERIFTGRLPEPGYYRVIAGP